MDVQVRYRVFQTGTERPGRGRPRADPPVRALVLVLDVGDVRVVERRVLLAAHAAAAPAEPLRVGVQQRRAAAAAGAGADGSLRGARVVVRGAPVPEPGAVASLSLDVPRSSLPVDDAVLVRAARPGAVAGGAVLDAVVRPVLRGMVGHLEELSQEATADLRTSWLSVVTLLVSSLGAVRDGAGDGAEQAAEADRRRALRFIDEHLADPGLDPTALAAALSVSRRTLYRLLAAEGGGVAAVIRDRRLAVAHALLADPVRPASVAEVRSRVGLPVAAHFSRAFRATYGVTPGEVRAGAAGASSLTLRVPVRAGRPRS